jgi:LPXTG-site transpeptidase (sortase) family protein
LFEENKRFSFGIKIVAFLGFILLAVLILYFIPKSSTRSGSALIVENATILSEQGQTSVGLPARLKIPEINVNAAIKYMGLTPEGAMDVPKDPAEVVWFNLGPRPGENGSAVIAGHYGWKNNIPAVFDNLHKLRKGDKLAVEDEKGVTIIFIVREIRIYNKDEAAPDVFGSNDEKAHLNLITCTGTWDKTEKIRSDRLIVFTDKEEIE